MKSQQAYMESALKSLAESMTHTLKNIGVPLSLNWDDTYKNLNVTIENGETRVDYHFRERSDTGEIVFDVIFYPKKLFPNDDVKPLKVSAPLTPMTP